MLSKVPECSICMSFLCENISVTSCGHLFHSNCINQLRSSNILHCPNCRSLFNSSTILYHSFLSDISVETLKQDLQKISEEKRLLEEAKSKTDKFCRTLQLSKAHLELECNELKSHLKYSDSLLNESNFKLRLCKNSKKMLKSELKIKQKQLEDSLENLKIVKNLEKKDESGLTVFFDVDVKETMEVEVILPFSELKNFDCDDEMMEEKYQNDQIKINHLKDFLILEGKVKEEERRRIEKSQKFSDIDEWKNQDFGFKRKLKESDQAKIFKMIRPYKNN